MLPSLKIQADRPTLRPGGGRRYLLFQLAPAAPVGHETALVIARSDSLRSWGERIETLVTQLVSLITPAALLVFSDSVQPIQHPQELSALPWGSGSCLQQAWLTGCHAIAQEEVRFGHCILITDGQASVGENRPEILTAQAAEIWERTGIATSVLAVGAHPQQQLLRALAWQGGGSCLRVRPGQPPAQPSAHPRLLLEVEAPPEARVEILTRTRGLAVVSGLGRVVAQVRLGGPCRLRARLRDAQQAGPWQTFEFVEGEGGHQHPQVMRWVGEALAQRTCDPRPRVSRTAEGAAELVGRFVPATCAWPGGPVEPQSDQHSLVQDLCRGCLVWGAVATALGLPLVGLEPATIRSRYGPGGVQHYEPWPGAGPESRGMYSGDLEMVREVAETLVECAGRFDPETFSQRLVALLAHNRGIGQACERAGAALAQGRPWWKAGLLADSAGNGAALRAAPLGLVGALGAQPSLLFRDTVVSALVTHTHPVGVAGALVMALGVAWCLRQRVAGGPLDPPGLLSFLAGSIEGVEPRPTPERRVGAPPTTMCQRLRELPELLSLPAQEALQVTWNGAFALESVPAALYCFLKFPEDPRQALLTAVNAGSDADSVGCMTAQLAGCWCGAARLERESPAWWIGLEGREGLLTLADRLAQLAWHPQLEGSP